MVYWKNIFITTFLLIIYGWNNKLKTIKSTYPIVISLYLVWIIYDRKVDKTSGLGVIISLENN